MYLTMALVFLLGFAPQMPPAANAPLRNTFVTAAETVIDNASRVDLKADLTISDAQMKQVDSAKESLSKMAEDDREKDAAAVVNDMVFQLSACRLQATNGAGTDACKAQFDRARLRAMEAIRKHKSGDSWVDGAPAY